MSDESVSVETLEEKPKENEMDVFLQKAPIRKSDRHKLPLGTNLIYPVIAGEKDKEVLAVFRPKSGEMAEMRAGIESGTYYLREVASFRVAKALGTSLIPPSVVREDATFGGIGSLQEYVTGAGAVSGRDLDIVLWNSDRKLDNCLIGYNNNFHPMLQAIDNGLTFGNTSLKLLSDNGVLWNLLPEHYWDKNLPVDLVKTLKNLVETDGLINLKSELENLDIKSEEAQACVNRIKNVHKIISENGGKIPESAKDQLLQYNPTQLQ